MNIWVFCGLLTFAFCVSLLLFGHYEKQKRGDTLGIITFVLLLTTIVFFIFGIVVYNRENGWKEVSAEYIYLDEVKAREITYVGEDDKTYTIKDVTLYFIPVINKLKKVTYEKRILFLVWTKTEVLDTD